MHVHACCLAYTRIFSLNNMHTFYLLLYDCDNPPIVMFFVSTLIIKKSHYSLEGSKTRHRFLNSKTGGGLFRKELFFFSRAFSVHKIVLS